MITMIETVDAVTPKSRLSASITACSDGEGRPNFVKVRNIKIDEVADCLWVAYALMTGIATQVD